jgi:hypothetical protein
MAESLKKDGFWTNYRDFDDTEEHHRIEVLPEESVRAIRQQSIALREEGRFEQSWSEKYVDGQSVQFKKEGVFATEPDGQDYETAPDMLHYMSTLITTLPIVLNQCYNNVHNDEDGDEYSFVPLNLSNQAFNAKLAVTSAGGSTYPLHIDNTLGVTGSPNDDTRKLTCILYLNPDYVDGDGGELKLMLLDNKCWNLTPRGGRMLLFWSDAIPHEVLPHKPDNNSAEFDRYALTIWFPDNDPRNIQKKGSKFEVLRGDAFDSTSWC